MGKTVTSLKDLGVAMGMRIKPRAFQERPLKCRKCGAEMEHVSDTNVFVCHGTVTIQDTEGKEITKPCGNTFLSKN